MGLGGGWGALGVVVGGGGGFVGKLLAAGPERSLLGVKLVRNSRGEALGQIWPWRLGSSPSL